MELYESLGVSKEEINEIKKIKLKKDKCEFIQKKFEEKGWMV